MNGRLHWILQNEVLPKPSNTIRSGKSVSVLSPFSIKKCSKRPQDSNWYGLDGWYQNSSDHPPFLTGSHVIEDRQKWRFGDGFMAFLPNRSVIGIYFSETSWLSLNRTRMTRTMVKATTSKRHGIIQYNNREVIQLNLVILRGISISNVTSLLGGWQEEEVEVRV